MGASQKSKNRNSRKSQNYHEIIDYSYISSVEPPVAGKVDHQSIEFTWINLSEIDATGENRLRFEIQEEIAANDYRTVYNGFSDNYKVEGLQPLKSYKYRLVAFSNDQQLATSSPVIVSTSDEPYDADQFHKAVIKDDIWLVEKIAKTGDVDINARDKYGHTPLMVAAQKNLINMVQTLIDLKADVFKEDSSGKNCLMHACFTGNQEIATKLRLAGMSWNDHDKSGSTALHYAVDSCDRLFVQWVIEDGANIEAKDTTSGWTPLLRCAATTGDADVARSLLAANANVNVQDDSGKSALMMSSLNGHLRLTRLLLEYGANVHLKSSHGKTCLDMALSFDRQSTVSLLENALHKEKNLVLQTVEDEIDRVLRP